MTYRKDIQVLRGIAVLLVVFFHLELPGFSSGFLGVDVFFVISGYLMAQIYDPARMSDFFVKRARRLLPAYFAVVLLVLLAATFLITPNDYTELLRQSRFAAFLVPNVGFWMDNPYFDKSVFKPLLHLWSLGVEIQFYLLVPILVWAFRRWPASFGFVLVSSGVACFYVVSLSATSAFFMLPFRLWQFLIGFGVAAYLRRRDPALQSRGTWIGLAALVVLIGIPAIRLEGGQAGFLDGHPGAIALLISIATATVIQAGLPRVLEGHSVATLLERIGGYSYSIYLAHYPVIVLFLYRPFSGTVLKPDGPLQTAILVGLIAVASVLLHRLVERPMRWKPLALAVTGASAAAVLIIGPLGANLQKSLVPPGEMRIYSALYDRGEFRCGKFYSLLNRGRMTCEITAPLARPSQRVLLVGNSFADSIKGTFRSVAEARNATVYFMVHNDPLMASSRIGPERLADEARALQVDAVVLHFSPGAVDLADVRTLAARLEQLGIRLAYVMPPPVWSEPVPRALWLHEKANAALPRQDAKDYLAANRSLIEGLADMEGELTVHEVVEEFCPGPCDLVSADGRLLYFDVSHLTLTGSERLRGVFERLFDELQSGQPGSSG
jgi:peptidoglycan/LPS O-acetylase OafA/YrhL